MTTPESHARGLFTELTAEELHGLGRRIAQRRRSRGWMQKELARQASLDPARLSRLERGKATPKLQEVIKLRAVLGGTIDDLLFEPEAPGGEPLSRLVQEIEQLATEDQLRMLGELTRLLVLGLRGAADLERNAPC